LTFPAAEADDPVGLVLVLGLGLEKSQKLPELYEAVAKMGGAEYLNVGSVISIDGVDGLHLTAESERKLGVAVASTQK
jgi:hypothetical protein